MLTDRWTRLRPHPEQYRYWSSAARFNVVAAGRRSGKTELGKRKMAKRVIGAHQDARFFIGTPTRDQSKHLYWEDMKKLIPEDMVTKKSESELFLRLIHGPELWVVGLDRPQRIEGRPWDGALIDEIADVKPDAWQANIRPALADRAGWCDFIGVPEGRNHFYKLHRRGRTSNPDWASFHWVSADILPPSEIRAAAEDMDEDMFRQEFEASFVSFRGRAYRHYTEQTHEFPGLAKRYRRDRPLIFCFDFNVEPGGASVLQEMRLPNGVIGTAAIGEVYIPYDSDTPSVCRRLVKDWAGHEAPIYVYGDATGGQRRSSGVRGTDWDLVKSHLKGEFDRIIFKVPKVNPPEKARLNAFRARIKAKSGTSRFALDPDRAPQLSMDLEGVTLLEGGSGEVNKKADPARSHWADGVGYYIAARFPIRGRGGAGRVPASVGG